MHLYLWGCRDYTFIWLSSILQLPTWTALMDIDCRISQHTTHTCSLSTGSDHELAERCKCP